MIDHPPIFFDAEGRRTRGGRWVHVIADGRPKSTTMDGRTALKTYSEMRNAFMRLTGQAAYERRYEAECRADWLWKRATALHPMIWASAQDQGAGWRSFIFNRPCPLTFEGADLETLDYLPTRIKILRQDKTRDLVFQISGRDEFPVAEIWTLPIWRGWAPQFTIRAAGVACHASLAGAPSDKIWERRVKYMADGLKAARLTEWARDFESYVVAERLARITHNSTPTIAFE